MILLRHTVTLSILFIMQLVPAWSQHRDIEAIKRWSSADLISYHIVGEYNGQPSIASNGSGRADVTDRVVIDLKWKLSGTEAGTNLVGTPTVQNSRSVLRNPHDMEPACLPPVLKGEYEHYEVLGIKPGMAGALEMQVETTYPLVEIAQSCTASRKSVPAKHDIRPEELVVPSALMLGMPLPDSDDLSISPDKKSLLHKRGGWTWTFTPTIESEN